MINKILSYLGMKIIRRNNSNSEIVQPKYQIGEGKRHNSLIDTLVPEMVEIGNNFVSAPNSMILAHDASTLYHCNSHRVEKTIIGNNVFLGASAIILPGVIIGDNVIIGAGSIVTKSFPEDVVIAGNPAKIICKVEDYIKKCKIRDVLVESPPGFTDESNSISQECISEFRERVKIKINKKK